MIAVHVVFIINFFYNGSFQQLLNLRHEKLLPSQDPSELATVDTNGMNSSSLYTAGYLRNNTVINPTTFQPLPLSVVDRVRTYVFFIGVGRSGHSIIGVLLDSHPHIVISDELDVFSTLLADQGVNRSSLFNQIWYASYKKAVTVDANTNLHSTSKGYSLAIDGLYQGVYQSYIDVIGDKMGGKTMKIFLANTKLFERRLSRLRILTRNVTIKVFHVIRNPFDNIATMVIYKHFKYNSAEVVKIKNGNNKLNTSNKLIDQKISYYFDLYQGAEVMRQQFNLDTMAVHGKDLIANPKVIINKMCDFLQVSCSDDYLNIVSRKIFSSESKTRYNVVWTDEQISKIKENIVKYDSLRQYLNFDS